MGVYGQDPRYSQVFRCIDYNGFYNCTPGGVDVTDTPPAMISMLGKQAFHTYPPQARILKGWARSP
jgi:hypothetical protein